MEGDGIERGIFGPLTLKVDSIPDAMIANVLGYLFFVLLIDENKSIVFGVGGIVEHPFSS
jgi:hypothetical protein